MTTLDDVDLARRYRDLVQADGVPSLHPSEEQWVQFAEGTLDEASRVRLADHIAVCGMCADTHRVVAAVRDAAAGVAPDATTARESAPWRPWYGLAAAAALALAVSSALWFARGPAPSPEAAPVVAAAPPGAAPLAGSADSAIAPAAAAVAPRAWAALPLAPAVTLPGSLALVVRGTAPDSQAFLAAFGAAIAPYRAAHYSEAAVSLETLTRSFPDVPEGWFYLGVSRLLASDAAGAIAPLERAGGSGVVGDEAAWLRAVALERAGRTAEASAALRALCTGTSGARQRACDAEGAAR